MGRVIEHGKWYKCSEHNPNDYPEYSGSDGVSVLYVSEKDSRMAFFAIWCKCSKSYKKWKNNEDVNPYAFMLCPKTPLRLAEEACELID